MRRLWPTWTVAPIAPFWAWAGFLGVRRELRWDHLVIAAVAAVLAYTGVRTKRVFLAVFPLGLVGLSYDAMRLVQHVGVSESTVHVCDLRALELRWFGIGEGAGRITLHDWFQARHVPWLDVLCAIPYGTFLFVVIAYALYLFFRDFDRGQRFAWGFLVLNLAGFVTYHVYPAAPPWYFHRYGCAVHLDAAASAGPNLTRVDAWLGFPYFAGLYGRASDVFGAVPSLHVAYPLLMAWVGWAAHRAMGRTLLVLFCCWMCFSAVYLDHHWVVDVVVGLGYAFAVGVAMQRWKRAERWPAGAAAVLPETATPVAGESPTQSGGLSS